MDDTKRVALLEAKTIDNGQPVTNPVTAVRYQYDNHLGSACIELDETAQLITYEEYHPFGTTSYRAGRSLTETSLKRYKYVGKERDEETGLYYYGMRYYAYWLCRFVSVDPLQFKYPELTPFQYASNSPVSGIDLDGLEKTKPKALSIDELMQRSFQKVQEVQNTRDNIPTVKPPSDLSKTTVQGNTPPSTPKPSKPNSPANTPDPQKTDRETIIQDVVPDLALEGIKNKANNIADNIELENKVKGIKVTNFGNETQSTRKSVVTGNWIEKGWMTKRGPESTRGMGFATKRVKFWRQVAKFATELDSPFLDPTDLAQLMLHPENPFAVANPFSFLVDEMHSQIDQQELESAISAGYSHVKSLMDNCRTCDEMFSGMIMQYVTAGEMNSLMTGALTNMNQFSEISRNESLGYASLLYIGENGVITPMGHFSINK